MVLFNMSEDDELEALRKKRRNKFINRITTAKKQEEFKNEQEDMEQKEKIKLDEKKGLIMGQLLLPDALNYYKTIKSANPAMAETIENTLIYLITRNQIQHKLSLTDLQIMVRKISGHEPTIKVKRHEDEEAVDFQTKLKESK